MPSHRMLGVFVETRTVIGGFLFFGVFTAALGADLLGGFDPIEQDRAQALQPPRVTATISGHRIPQGTRSDEAGGPKADVHWFGTDALGRDVLSRTLHAARFSLLIALVGALGAVTLGGLVGGAAGWFGGTLDRGAMRFTELVMALPALYLVLAVRNLFPFGIGPLAAGMIVAFSLAAVGWMVIARMARARVLSLREQPFVSAAIAAGAPRRWLVWHHILPTLFPFLALQLGLSLPYFLMGEVSLSYLGLGQVPPHPSWGGMLAQASEALGSQWWVWLSPASFLTCAVVGLNLLIDGIRHRLVPELSGTFALAAESSEPSVGSKQRRQRAS